MQGHLARQSPSNESLHQSYDSQLLALYAELLKTKKSDYLEAHSHNLAVIRRDTSVFRRYSGFVPAAGSVLDWGCHHAPTSCLVKMLRGDSTTLYGCDMHAEEFKAFYDFAKLQYTRLTHPYLLPYDDDFFDAVIGTAALEHVPNDSESLKELYRVIKPDGTLIITTLPNRLSYTEWLNRRLQRLHHNRLYNLGEARKMLLHHGFLPVTAGYHQVLPSMCSVGGIFESPLLNKFAETTAPLNEIAETMWPVRCFASNIFVVGKKAAMI